MSGVYEKNAGWRWTSRLFSFNLDPPQTDRAIYLEMELTAPEEIFESGPAIGMSARVNGVDAGRQIYRRMGRYYFTRYVPQAALARRPVHVEFELDRSVTSSAGEGGNPPSREQGIIFVAVALKDYEQTAEFRESRNQMTRIASDEAMKAIAAALSPAKVVELRKLFFSLPALQQLKYQGVPVDLNPLDLWMMQQAAFEVRPEFVIQTGSGEGGAALYWAHILNNTGLSHSKVLAIDRKNLAVEASKNALWGRYVEVYKENPSDPGLVSRILKRIEKSTTMVIIDSGGDVDAVRNEIAAYAPLVSRGSYLIVANTGFDADTTDRPRSAGPSDAVRRFLASAQGNAFEVDPSRDMLVLSSNPGGWLRRK